MACIGKCHRSVIIRPCEAEYKTLESPPQHALETDSEKLKRLTLLCEAQSMHIQRLKREMAPLAQLLPNFQEKGVSGTWADIFTDMGHLIASTSNRATHTETKLQKLHTVLRRELTHGRRKLYAVRQQHQEQEKLHEAKILKLRHVLRHQLARVRLQCRQRIDEKSRENSRLHDMLATERAKEQKSSKVFRGQDLDKLTDSNLNDTISQLLTTSTKAYAEMQSREQAKRAKRAEQKANNNNNNNNCCVCYESAAKCALQCGHLLCRVCADQVKLCPTCRAPITQRIDLFATCIA